MWTRPMTGAQQESTPLVYKGIMYLPNSGDIIQAYDVAGNAGPGSNVVYQVIV